MDEKNSGSRRGLQLANWALTILSTVLLTFSFTRADDDRWLWFGLTIVALFGAIGTELLRRRQYKAEQQRSILERTNV